MNIKLFINKSEDNKVYKNIEYINDVTGNLRLPTNILTPIIDIELDNYKSLTRLIDVVYIDNDIENEIAYIDDGEEYEVDAYTLEDKVFTINYIYIDEFNRYYFVKNIECLSNKLFRLYLSVDVLMSHKESFMLLEAVIERSTSNYNLYVEDTNMSFLYKNDVSYIMPNMYREFNTAVSPLKYNYVLTIYGTDDINIDITNKPLGTSLPSIAYTSSGKNRFNATYVTIWTYINKLAEWLQSNQSYASYLISVIAYPFYLSNSIVTEENLKLGDKTLSDVYVRIPDNSLGEYDERARFIISSSSYLDYEPYTKYELFLPYYGWVELKASDILDKEIIVYYCINYTLGTAKILIYDNVLNRIISSYNATIGVKISLNRDNEQQLNDEKTQLAIKSAISGIASLASIGVGAYTYNPYLIASGVSGLVGTAVDVGERLSMMHKQAQTSFNSGYDGLYDAQYPFIRTTKYVKNEPSKYSEYYGLPCNKMLKLNTLSGYTKVSDIHLEDIDAMQDEKANIETLLKNGVII